MGNDIKTRIKSLSATRQITKAMEMVAASKLRRAQAQLLHSRPYFEILSEAISNIVSSNRDFSSPYLEKRVGNKRLCLVIAGDRGLAGGYNSNILKLVESQIQDKEAAVLPIGKKAVDFFRSRNVTVLTKNYREAAGLSIGDCFSIAKELSRRYLVGEFDEIHVVYTNFVSVLSQTPASLQLLPLLPTGENGKGAARCGILCEPNCVEVFDAIIPEYLGGILYGALCESRVAEAAARRAAMDSATQNADEMLADLSLKYNRSRQAAITQEITEIVAGS